MAMISVPALYDGKEIRLLESAPVQGAYRVLVTFVAPADEPTTLAQDLTFLDAQREALLAQRQRWQDIVKQAYRIALSENESYAPHTVLSAAEIRLRMNEYLPSEEKLSEHIVAMREE